MSAPGLAARRGAAALLAGVRRQTGLSEQIAGDAGPLTHLAPDERARAQTLATDTLRHLGRIDALLARFLERPPPAAARDLLRLATAEMLVDDVPAHAAVDAAVRLAQETPRTRRQAGLVNAVGRRVAVDGPDLWRATPEGALPDWLAGRLVRAYGAEASAAISAAHVAGRPPVDLTLRDRAEAADWAGRLDALRLPTGSLRLIRPGRLSGLPGYAAGAWWVQDAAAALPARLFGDLAGRMALDLCAAPGGKTLQLAAAGARVTALDVSRARLARLSENLARTGLSAEIVVADALEWTPETRFHAVLLDAPCTATGTIRRHPELPLIRGAAELGPLTALQTRMMQRAWDRVAPAGTLVYATCSLLPEEGEETVAAFRSAHPDAEPRRPDPDLLGIDPAWVDLQGGLRLRPDYWPEHGGMDGFYACALTKPADAA